MAPGIQAIADPWFRRERYGQLDRARQDARKSRAEAAQDWRERFSKGAGTGARQGIMIIRIREDTKRSARNILILLVIAALFTPGVPAWADGKDQAWEWYRKGLNLRDNSQTEAECCVICRRH